MKSAKGMIHSLFVPHWRHVWKLKEITKLEKISLSDFTLCGAKLLPKLAPIHWLFVPAASACLEV